MPFKLGPDESRRQLLEAEVERITRLLPSLGVQKAVLFGSAAHGDVTETSDLDLILVKETSKRFLDRIDEALLALRPRVALDLVVYTPGEFRELLETRPAVREAVNEGRVLYEA